MPTEKNPRELVPNPDPSVLTTAALLREIEGLREQTIREIKMNRELIEARLDGNDAAVALLRTTADKIPYAIKESVQRLQELHDEKFLSIQTQFKERDTRTEQTSKDSKVAVDAALQAAKEAVGEQNKSSALAIAKSEAATTKQIDLIGTQIGQVSKSADDKIADIKERITSIEARGAGVATQKQETNQNWGFIFGAGGLVVAIISVVLLAIRFSAT